MIDNNTLNKLAELLDGLPIVHIMPGSVTEKAGIKVGDILLEVNGMPIPDADAFIEARALVKDGMSFKVWREGSEIEGEVSFDIE